jgi:mono/diheme cytochrome c family protein
MSQKIVGIGLGLGVLLLAGLAWLTAPDWREGRAPEAKPFSPTAADVEKGRYLVRAGNCAGCHTAQGQPDFAGGRRIPTPFGDVFSSNLTPDAASGIGAWSSADFWQAMHQGKSRDGRLLTPAFPFTDYTRLTRKDSDALFAYLRSLTPVAQKVAASQLRFPYGTVLAQKVWRALYFTPGTLLPDAAQSAAWNRGAYLVEGLGHCDACHTPRDALGGLRALSAFAGGPIPMLGWDAPPLPPVAPMSDADAQDMRSLLKNGVSRAGVAGGPMADVVFHSLQYLSNDDIAAMVDYIRTLPSRPSPPRRRGLRVGDEETKRLTAIGSVVYKEHCSECHGDDGRGKPGVYPALAGSPLVTAVSATNAIQSVLHGGFGPGTAGNPQPYGMPPYRHQLDNDQIAGVLTYIRGNWGNAAPPVSSVEAGRY